MIIGFTYINNHQLKQLVHKKYETRRENLDVHLRRAMTFLYTGTWLNGQKIYDLLNQNNATKQQISNIFKNARINPTLAQKVNAATTTLKPYKKPLPNVSTPHIKPTKKLLPQELFNFMRNTGIITNRPKLYEFLTDKPNMQYTRSDYDFSFEDEFGVIWINQKEDADFIKAFKSKYKDSLDILSEMTSKTRPIPFEGESTRFANNDSFAFLNLGHTKPIAKDMIRDIMIWGATKEACRMKGEKFSQEEILKHIFG